MAHETLHVEIDGTEVRELDCDLVSLEVELDDELAGMFRMTLALRPRADGTWALLDDERFTVWRRVAITASVADDTERLLTGFVTHLRPEFGAGLAQCRLAVWGMDASVLMDRADKLKDWPNKKDSDIAAEIIRSYGLTPRVTDTEVIHDEEVSTIIQRETDIQLLRRLARRNGFECFVTGDVGYFGPPAVGDTPQAALAVHRGAETNVNRFSLEVNALAPATVAMVQQDHGTGETLHASAAAGRHPPLGARPPDDWLAPGMTPSLVHIGQTVATGAAEMGALCQSLCDQGAWFVTGEGEVSANKYGGVLMPRRPVRVVGVGETHTGVYYVTHVTHRFTADGYSQRFQVKRNALRPVKGPGGLRTTLVGVL